jgi:protocatechuate 3,4-dioxygenase beta subunit
MTTKTRETETVYERAQKTIDESREFLNRLPEHLHEDTSSSDPQGLATAFYFDEEPTKARTNKREVEDRDTRGLASALYYDGEEPTKARAHNKKIDERDTKGLASAFYFDDEAVH